MEIVSLLGLMCIGIGIMLLAVIVALIWVIG